MKRIITGILMVSFFCVGQMFCETLSPKKMACKQACETVRDECKKKAAGDTVVSAACDAACQKCIDECK